MSGPDVWGPHGWKFIHYITLGYPYNAKPEERQKYKDFFYLLSDVIPCSICGHNYATHLEIKPLTDDILKNKMDFINWGIDMHNLVNKDNRKKVLTYEDGLHKILDCTKDCKYIENVEFLNNENKLEPPKKKNKDFIFIFVIVILVFIIFYQYGKNNI